MKEPSKYKNEDNLGFVQVSRKYLSGQRALGRKSYLAREILDFMIEKMDRKNAIMVSHKTLQELFGYGKVSVSKAVKVLKDENWVQIIKVGNMNSYLINAAAFWTSGKNEKNYAMFDAVIITSETEQKETIADLKNQELKQIPKIAKDEQIVFDSDEELERPDQKDLKDV